MKHTLCNTLVCMVVLLIFSHIACAAQAITPGMEGRPAKNDADLQYWLANLAAHQFTADEAAAALRLSTTDAASLLENFQQDPSGARQGVPTTGAGHITLLPYPGGRHPRIGFLEGAVQPQRETKISIFPPWKDGGYIVVDLPEAVWHLRDEKKQLLYLAHTHVPTIWTEANVTLPPLEWNREQSNRLSLTRELPNKVSMTSKAWVVKDGVKLEFSITNGTSETLTDLRIQMCGMLKGLTGFAEQTNDNKVFQSPFAACRNHDGNRWVILGFDHCNRVWGNTKCPCLHSDPQVPDCQPAETQTVHGWVSFFEGDDVTQELKRLESVAFESSVKP